jgi:arylsulfatase A-like enzyme
VKSFGVISILGIMRISKLLLVLLLTAPFTSCSMQEKNTSANRPNVVLILADDMGYSDLGCYGSEISTPNLDSLAANGIRFSRFYNGARCCPTRASLLTGLYAHQTGVGGMVKQVLSEKPDDPFQGYLNSNCITLGEILKKAGYRTMMSGKWHVGEFKDQWPRQRGFDRYYGLISGAMNFFNIEKGKENARRVFLEDNQEVRPRGQGFYATSAFTDAALGFLDESESEDKPFFLYLAYNAPHYPLHALPGDIAKYRGKYIEGWETLRQNRFRRMMETGILTDSHLLSPPHSDVVPWDEVENQEEMDLKMAIYAAQVESMDRGIGEVVEKIRTLGEMDNTLIMFLSDNGACAETSALGGTWMERTGELGSENSYESYGLCWANAGNTPFRKFKRYTAEGGILTPFIAHWPAEIKPGGEIVRDPSHIIDIMPTLCEICKAEYPKEFNENPVIPAEGQSLLPLLQGKPNPLNRVLCWEHLGEKAALSEPWKIVKGHQSDTWELHNLAEDPVELHNLSDQYPEKKEEMIALYQSWAERMGMLE